MVAGLPVHRHTLGYPIHGASAPLSFADVAMLPFWWSHSCPSPGFPVDPPQRRDRLRLLLPPAPRVQARGLGGTLRVQLDEGLSMGCVSRLRGSCTPCRLFPL